MTWEDAIEIVLERTGHVRYRELCDEAWPDHEAYRALVIRMAGGSPEAPPNPKNLIHTALREFVAKHGCCGGNVTG